VRPHTKPAANMATLYPMRRLLSSAIAHVVIPNCQVPVR